MPIYEITAPNGKTYEVEGNGTEAQALEHFKQNYQAETPKETPKNPYEASMKSALSNIPESKKIMGSALGGLGGETLKSIGAMMQLANPKYGTPITQFGEAMANASKEANPVGGTVGQIASYVAPTSSANNLLPSVSGLLPNVAKQVGIGGALGYGLTPGDNQERLKEAGINAAMGGVLPVVGTLANKSYQGVKSLVEPLYEQGKNAIIARALRQFAGGESDTAIKNLLASEPTVKGSLPTVGQASGVPSLAAAERALQGSSPEATNMLANRQKSNALARSEALENIATPTRIEKYTDLRKKIADDLYSNALNTEMQLTPALEKEINGLIKSPSIQDAIGQARKNALDKGIDIKDPKGSLRGLHETKMALDDEIAKLSVIDPTSAQKARKDALLSAKDRLLGFIENVSPEYKQARETFARLSKPVDQLEKISKIADKSVRFKDETIKTNQYFQELEKLQKEGLLSKQQMARLTAVGEDLKLKDFAENAGRGVGSNTMQNLAYGNMANQAGVPNMLRNMAGGQIVGNMAKRVGQALYSDANKQLTNQMAETMLSPKRAAQLMQMPDNSNINTDQAQKLAKLLTLQLSTQGEK